MMYKLIKQFCQLIYQFVHYHIFWVQQRPCFVVGLSSQIKICWCKSYPKCEDHWEILLMQYLNTLLSLAWGSSYSTLYCILWGELLRTVEEHSQLSPTSTQTLRHSPLGPARPSPHRTPSSRGWTRTWTPSSLGRGWVQGFQGWGLILGLLMFSALPQVN